LEKIDACILTFIHYPSIHPNVIQLQKAVVQKYNPSNYPHHVLQMVDDEYPLWFLHGHSIYEYLMGWSYKDLKRHDVVIMLDIDAIPLSNDTFDILASIAKAGSLVGCIQKHTFNKADHFRVSAFCGAFSMDTYEKMGKPICTPTSRGDTIEELTYAAEKEGIPVEYAYPYHSIAGQPKPKDFDRWKYADGQMLDFGSYQGNPVIHGIGVSYEFNKKPFIFHNFQTNDIKNQQMFANKCVEVLNNE